MLREAVSVMPGFSRVAEGEKGEHRQQTRGGRCVCMCVCARACVCVMEKLSLCAKVLQTKTAAPSLPLPLSLLPLHLLLSKNPADVSH